MRLPNKARTQIISRTIRLDRVVDGVKALRYSGDVAKFGLAFDRRRRLLHELCKKCEESGVSSET
jgi:hypothetical protein